MELKEALLKELVKQGPLVEDGKRTWNIARRNFLYWNEALAKSFLKLRNHPRYRATIFDKEIDLIKKNKNFILNEIKKEPFNLIDMGCGDGTKAKVFLGSFEGNNLDIRYFPVSVTDYLSGIAIQKIRQENFPFVKDIMSHNACYEDLAEVSSKVRGVKYQKNVTLLLGSILASFEINDYLFHASNAMFKGDYLIIGNGIRKGERLVNIETYKHPAFSEWFILLMKELGFSESEVEYGARFNEMRVEMFYRIKNNKTIEYKGRKIEFKQGDEILVAVVYKFYENELKKFCEMYFSDVKLFEDADEEYALVFCRK